MPVLPFGPNRPDVSDYSGQATKTAINCVPRGDGYGPFNGLVPYSTALPAPCRGFFYGRNADGTVKIFAGTSTKLYVMNNTTQVWVDASLAAGTYTALSSTGQWSFAQFNNFIIAVQQNCNPQVYDLTSSSAFADLGGSPPQAAYVSIVNRFVVLSGLASPNVYRIQWSGLNSPTTWDNVTLQSNFQDLADGGITRGVGGGEYGVIFQDTAIRTLTYAPGSPIIFGIERISKDIGLLAPYSLIAAGDRIFFLSRDGFKMLAPGQYPQPIGKEKFDRTFLSDADLASPHLIIGAADPQATRVYWAYKSNNGIPGQFDKILVYDWALDNSATITINGEYIATMAQPPLTLEGVDAVYGANIDTLALGSFDDISTAALAQLSGAGIDNKLGFFAGPAIEAVLETPEQGGDGRRVRVNGFRPVTDAPSVFGSVMARENAQTASVQSQETAITAQGICPQRVSTRYARAHVRIPAGTAWTFAMGVEPDVALEGMK